MDNYVDKDSHTTVLHWRYYYDPPEFQVYSIHILYSYNFTYVYKNIVSFIKEVGN